MNPRPEQDIFNELAVLCSSPGYPHVVAYLTYRDNVIGYGDVLESDDYLKNHSPDRLIRTEISTLIGLMARAPIDLSLPTRDELETYLNRTEALLEELHYAVAMPFAKDRGDRPNSNPFSSADAMREPIFYGAESAYSFQYRDLAQHKYHRDAAWLQQNKGFDLDQAVIVAKTLARFQNNKMLETLRELATTPPDERSILPGFMFDVADVVKHSGLPRAVVMQVLQAFTFADDGNKTFNSLQDFNATNAFPLLKIADESFVLFQYMSFAEALYDTPFFWMFADKRYSDTAATNRGLFAEDFGVQRLVRVFGAENVYRNVDIWKSKGAKLGEIDVLVLFGDRAIVVQAKSKRLTLAARKGNDLQLKADFKGAVQDACDQALDCGRLLVERSARYTDASGREIVLPTGIKTVYPLCLVSDHFPALSFQARQFLKTTTLAKLETPLVCDVFFLDTVTEMLETPLRLLSYLELRSLAGNSVMLSHEHTALGFHLKQNLWIEDAHLFVLVDDISADLDVSMAVRREGISGRRTPEGILTTLEGTAVGSIVAEIERGANPAAIDVGLHLLKLSGSAARDLSGVITRLANKSASDGMRHDATIGIDKASTGLTIHCTGEDHISAALALKNHCELRKYKQRAQTWCGMAVEPGTGQFRFGFVLNYPWKLDTKLEQRTAHISPGRPASALKPFIRTGSFPRVGRNEACPCGSGRKFKRCHGAQ